LIFLFIFVWLRGTMPRLRYDQFMRFGWKVLIPLNLVWILALAGIRVLQNSDVSAGRRVLIVAIVVVVVLVLALPFLFGKERPEPVKPGDVEPQIGGFPVPPMDLTVPPSPRLRRVEGVRAGVTVPAGEPDSGDEGGSPSNGAHGVSGNGGGGDHRGGSGQSTESEV